MAGPLSGSKLKLYRALGEDIKGDRLAIDMLLAVVAGDELPEALERLKETREKLPGRRDGRKNADRIFNEIGARGREMLDQAIHDLEQLLEHERERDGAART